METFHGNYDDIVLEQTGIKIEWNINVGLVGREEYCIIISAETIWFDVDSWV